MISRIINHIRIPLFRNGYSLVLSSFGTSGLGIIYWIIAARLYRPEIVGLNSAALSAVMFLALVAQFNLVNGLNRFLPAAGLQTRRMVVAAYLISGVMGAVVSLIFIAGLSMWAPSLSFLTSSPLFIATFVMFTVSWGLFALQDSALTGIRQAIWVPVKNIFFAIIKIVLLIVFVSLIPAYGILVSWLIPVVLSLVGINFLLFRRLIPRHVEQTKARSQPVEARTVASYVAGDYVASLFWMGAAYLQPIIVTQMLGAEANAYFYLPWQIAYALYLVSLNMGMSLIAEAAADPIKLNNYSFRVLKQSSLLIIPAVVVILIGAPWILRLFGADYEAEGITLLRLLSLSAIPHMIFALSISIARVQRNIRALIATQATISVLVLVMIYFFIGRFGITGIGYAWLISQTLVAIGLAATRLRFLLLSHLNLDPLLRLSKIPRGIVRHWKNRKQVNDVNEVITQIRDRLNARGDVWNANALCAQKVMFTVSDVTVVTMGIDGEPPEALLKLANSDKAVESMKSQKQVISQLRRDERLYGWNNLMPSVISEGELEGHFYMVEKMLPGMDARSLIKKPKERAQMLKAAQEAISELHQHTAATVLVDNEVMRRWVDDRLMLIRELNSTSHSPLKAYNQGIEKLTEELHQALSGKTLPISWIHGDYSPGNILVSEDGRTVTGIIDWDQATEDVPMIDMIHLLLSVRILLQKRELGDVIRALLEEEDAWSEDEMALLNAAQSHLPGDVVDMRALLLLTWLHHIAANLSKSSRYSTHWLWVTKNVEVVLGSL
jgi:O-antigen/teichoic acid export membrane protein/Ser/Thr protein kinase RdoA (MazF antagonist)